MQDTRFDNYLAQQQQKKTAHDKGLTTKVKSKYKFALLKRFIQ